MDQVIHEYLLEEYQYSRSVHTVESHKVLGVTEQEGIAMVCLYAVVEGHDAVKKHGTEKDFQCRSI
ncbi:hypothetical protein [Peribacillus sp. SCS-155]|uniref:hypothetical protein n=1 Tax=Peribacillus sedimenti TaxID=3115297 RepID=UPI003906A73D